MEKTKNNYVLGIIGALLGGLIATIPWILFYVYANMIYSLLAIFVAMAALKGYELFRGKVDNKLPYIITIVSFLSITIATLVIIPNLLILKEFGTISLANFKLLYQTSEFTSALMGDYVISLLFTGLGIAGIIKNIKKQVNNGSEKIDLNYNEYAISDEERTEVRKVFERYNALDKHNAISKENLFAELEHGENEINYLINQGYIKQYKKNYYYVLKAENTKNQKLKSWIILGIMLVVVFGISLLATNNPIDTKEDVIIRDVTFDVPNKYQEYENEYDGWTYVPKKDLSGESGFIDIALYEELEINEDYEAFKESIKVTLEESYNVVSTDDYNNAKDNKVMVYVIETEEYRETIYYIFKDNKIAVVDAIDYYDTKDSNIVSDAESIVKNFDWK